MRDKIMVTQSSMPEFDEYVNEIRDIWDSVWLTNMGTKHRQLQKQLSGLLQVPEVSLFCNGHMALELTLQAFELSGQVITTPYSFASTTHAIVRNNLTPVFCDIRVLLFLSGRISEIYLEKGETAAGAVPGVQCP